MKTISKVFKTMQNLNLFKLVFGSLLLMMMLPACQDEEFTTTGTLNVTFRNHPDDLTVLISPAENPQVYITNVLRPDSNGGLTYSLNYGNYILNSASATYFPQVAFQVRANETTVISFDSNNVPSVQ